MSLDRTGLPTDLVSRGHGTRLIQELLITTKTMQFLRERFYSPSEHRIYMAPLPPAYVGHQFGPNVRAFVLQSYYDGNMSRQAIVRFLTTAGIDISHGTVQAILEDPGPFAAEYDAIGLAGLGTEVNHHTDKTSTRVDGIGHQTVVLCGLRYTLFRTLRYGNRRAIIGALRLGAPLTFRLDEIAHAYLANQKGHAVSEATKARLRTLPQAVDLDETAFRAVIYAACPHLEPKPATDAKGPPATDKEELVRILDAAAVAAYWAQDVVPVIHRLIADDAGEFRAITAALGLCWVHGGRHYKRITAILPAHQAALEQFIERFWAFFHQLHAYKSAPTDERARALDAEFDTLFSTTTGFAALDARIAKTAASKVELLQVLRDPTVPLTNNPAELAARLRVTKRTASYGPRSAKGARAWDIYQSILDTARKLGVNIHDYLVDRISHRYALRSLADTIRQKAAEANAPPPGGQTSPPTDEAPDRLPVAA